MAVEMDSGDVVRLIVQFLAENGLAESAATLQRVWRGSHGLHHAHVITHVTWLMVEKRKNGL